MNLLNWMLFGGGGSGWGVVLIYLTQSSRRPAIDFPALHSLGPPSVFLSVSEGWMIPTKKPSWGKALEDPQHTALSHHSLAWRCPQQTTKPGKQQSLLEGRHWGSIGREVFLCTEKCEKLLPNFPYYTSLKKRKESAFLCQVKHFQIQYGYLWEFYWTRTEGAV